MSTPDGIPTHNEQIRLREYAAGLEEEVTRLRQSLAEAEQRSSNVPHPGGDNYYREVFDHLSVCMFFIDVTPDGRFRYAGFNPAEEEALGLSTEQVAGKFVEDVFPQDLAQKLTRNYRLCVDAGKPITYDDELNLPAGRRHFHSNLIPLTDSAGRIHRIVGACIDTTDLKRTQEEALSRQKLESLGVLAAGIAHDFNNLLGSILAEAELAEVGLAAGEVPRREIRAIQSAATRAGEIVRELMTYAGQGSTTLEPTDLSLLVREMLELLKVSVSKKASLRIDLPNNLPAVQANPVQLRQVIMNLITNASEALGNMEGVISISAAPVTDQNSIADRPAAPARGDYVRLAVNDTGCGMTQDILCKIFDPFYTTKISGRGLGLAAVQGIIRSHNGTITVTSAPGEGSQFEILLPCAAQPLPDTTHRGATSSMDGSRIFGVIPDYQTVTDSTGPVTPLTPKQKWTLALKESVDPFNVLNAAMGAAFSQRGNQTPKYGEGGAAYARRFGAALGDFGTQNFFSAGVLATLLHQDPRYYRKGPGTGVAKRAIYSVSRLVIARQDSGASAFNVSGIGGMALGIAASNLYYPAVSVRGSVMACRVSTSLTGGIMGNLMSEFWPDLQKRFFHKRHPGTSPEKGRLRPEPVTDTHE